MLFTFFSILILWLFESIDSFIFIEFSVFKCLTAIVQMQTEEEKLEEMRERREVRSFSLKFSINYIIYDCI